VRGGDAINAAIVSEPTRALSPPARSVRIGTRRYPVVPPSIRDPRIHLGLVVVSTMVIGIGWLGFRLSIPQIVVTLVVCAVLEVLVVMRRTGAIVWPGSALQTANSTALVLRVVGTGRHDLWTVRGWYAFVLVAAFGLATKHLIRWHGQHVFNPSNIALLVAFLVLSSSRVEPLDFWWAPLGVPLLVAYAVILGGGAVIGRRLHLLEMSAAFFVTLAAGLAVVAALGHAITTTWSFVPVRGWHFWWIVMTSPELLIFLLFMITDPRTIPPGRVARIVFAVLVAVACTLLIAPWGSEYGAKVGLLAGLAVVSVLRPVVERWSPAPGSADDHPVAALGRLVAFSSARPGAPTLARLAVVVLTVGAVGGAVALASLPNRSSGAATAARQAMPSVALGDPADVDPASLPAVVIDPEVAALSARLATPAGAQRLAATLAWNFRVEAQALAAADPSLLTAVDHGARLRDLQDRIQRASRATRVVPTYVFSALRLMVVYPGGFQTGPNAGFVSQGTLTETTYAASGEKLSETTTALATTFAMREVEPGHWLTTAVLPG
jgi:hypothetical protein